MKNAKRGVVLVWALITMAVTTTIVGALGAYYVHTAKIANVYMDRTADRFQGQYALEEAKSKIFSILGDVGLTPDPDMAIKSGSSFTTDLRTAVDRIENLLKDPIDVGNYTIVFEDAKASLEDIAKTGNGTLQLVAKVYDRVGGGMTYKPLVTLKEEIVFETAGTEALTTMEIFDYVYFANNCGHLDSSVVANGDIGANDRLELNGTRVNGYVNVRGSSYENATDITDAWMWPYQSYMVRVVEKIKVDLSNLYPGLNLGNYEYYTQIRPTDPIHVSDTETLDWEGGYQPPGFTSEFGEILSSGSFANGDPINPNAEKLAVYEQGYTNSATYATYYDVNTGKANVNPDQSEYNTYYNSDGSLKGNSLASDYNKYYDSNGNPRDYPDQSTYLQYYNANGTAKTNPNQTEYDKYYNSNGSKKTNPNTTEYNNYYNSNGSKKTNPLTTERNKYLNSDGSLKDNSQKSTFDTYFYFDSNGNVKEKDNPYSIFQTIKYAAWAVAQTSFKNNYLNSYKAWINEQKQWTAGGTQLTAYNNWNTRQNEIKGIYDNWNTAQNNIKEPYTSWNTAQSNAQTAKNNWTTAQSNFATSGKKAEYENWASSRSSWLDGGDSLNAYNNWNSNQQAVGDDYSQWDSDYKQTKDDYDQWDLEYNAWKDAYLKGGEEVELNKDTAHITDRESRKVVNVSDHFVEVPNLSDTNMNYYIEYCRNFTTNANVGVKGGTLHCLNQYDTTTMSGVQITLTNCYARRWQSWGAGGSERYAGKLLEPEEITPHVRTVNEVHVTGGVNITYGAGSGPITNPANSPFNAVAGLESGSVILIGTYEHPIIIDGPVYIPGDVVLRGFVKGQGTIYAGRNIHIVGDITYMNPPSWPHNNLSLAKNHPNKVAERNRNCDLLLLVARGNIVVGDYASDLWQSDTNMQFIRNYGRRSDYCNDFLESGIGYTQSFSRNYDSADGGKKVTVDYDCDTDSGMGTTYYGEWKPLLVYKKLTYTLKASQTSDRKYYESIFGSKVISELKQTMTTDPDQLYKVPSSLRQVVTDIINAVVSAFTGQEIQQKIAESDCPKDGDILQIDSVLFANHGIFGVVGGTSAPQFTLNGALLCRDEGLLPSFTERFKDTSRYDSKQKIWLNWDLRIKSDTSEGLVNTGAPMKISSNSKTVNIYVKSWQQQ